MFTGLVEETGEITETEKAGEGLRITLKADKVFEDASEGDSINVSGACLTLEKIEGSEARIFLAEETLDRTWFSDLEAGDTVNLERSLTPQDRMGGHYVQGHVDTVAEIKEVEELEEGWNFSFGKPEALESYVVEKSFISVDGISLTVTSVSEDSFSVTIIPETWKKTNLSDKNSGDQINIEGDIMAKFVEKNLENCK